MLIFKGHLPVILKCLSRISFLPGECFFSLNYLMNLLRKSLLTDKPSASTWSTNFHLLLENIPAWSSKFISANKLFPESK